MHVVENLSPNLKKWLLKEADFQLEEAYRCTVGQLTGRGKSFPFPRLIRSGDARARDAKDTEYRSIVSRFLREFVLYYEDEKRPHFEFPQLIYESAELEVFRNNFEFIKEQIKFLCVPSKSSPPRNDKTLDCDILSPKHFNHRGIKRLFEKLDTYDNGSDRDRALSAISNGTEADTIIRLILLASYVMHCVVLTRVETDDESSAFDIFDALNTTGEPLTAIETLKPRVIQYEESLKGGRYEGSESELAFDRIDKHLDERFKNPDDRQKETKELIVSYALYVDGTKQPRDLSSQRKYLRSCFEKIEKKAGTTRARSFVSGIGDLACFRQQYWEREGIKALGSHHSSPTFRAIAR